MLELEIIIQYIIISKTINIATIKKELNIRIAKARLRLVTQLVIYLIT